MKAINLLAAAILITTFSACSPGEAKKPTLVTKQVQAPQQSKPKVTRVLFYLQDGVEILDFAGPMEVFANAGFEVFIVSKTKAPIYAQSVLKIVPKYDITDAPDADIISFFGGANTALDDPEVITWLKNARKPDYYFSVCTGSFVFAKAGLLDGLKATTFHDQIDNLRKFAPKATILSNVRFVDNGTVITTAGISAGIDGALHMVSKILGPAKAKEIAETLEYDKWRPNEGLVVNKPKA